MHRHGQTLNRMMKLRREGCEPGKSLRWTVQARALRPRLPSPSLPFPSLPFADNLVLLIYLRYVSILFAPFHLMRGPKNLKHVFRCWYFNQTIYSHGSKAKRYKEVYKEIFPSKPFLPTHFPSQKQLLCAVFCTSFQGCLRTDKNMNRATLTMNGSRHFAEF